MSADVVNITRYLLGVQQALTVVAVMGDIDGIQIDGKSAQDEIAELLADGVDVHSAILDLIEAQRKVVVHWTSQYERQGHMAPPWARDARDALKRVGVSA